MTRFGVLALAFLLCGSSLSACATIAYPVTVPPPTGTITVGPREDVLCAYATCTAKPYAWPDDPMGIVKNGSVYTFYGSNDGNLIRAVGTLDNPVATRATPIVITGRKAPLDYMGGGPVYDTGSGTLLMFYHGEFWKSTTEFIPFFGNVGMAKSTDGGLTWTDLGLILTHQTPTPSPVSTMTDTRNMGTGTFIIKNENGTDYFYIYHENSQGPTTAGWNWANISVARASVASVLTAAAAGNAPTFNRYCNGSANLGTYTVTCPGGLWTELGLGGFSTPLVVANDDVHIHSVSTNTFLGKYILAGQCRDAKNGTVWPQNPTCLYESADGLSWTNRTVLFDEGVSQWYPTIVGQGESPQTISGQSFWVYYIYAPPPTYNNSVNRLSRRLITLLTAAGSPPEMSKGQPTIPLAAGTTQATIFVDFDKPSTCRYALTDIAYGSMVLDMTTTNLTASAIITGLTNGSSRTYYVRCQYIDTNGAVYPTPASLSITMTMLTATDITPPVRSGGLTERGRPRIGYDLDLDGVEHG